MEELELFHITCQVYALGKVEPIVSESYYHISTQSDNRSWINDFLDAHKPFDKVSRKKAHYACDSLIHCKALKSTVAKLHCIPRIYRVRMMNSSKYPMVLVNFLSNLEQGHTRATEIANEYWNPTEDWKFYEYLSNEMEIIEEVENEDLSQMGQTLFWACNTDDLIDDSRLAKVKYII